MKETMFIAQIEVRRLEGAKMPRTMAGAYVHCYIPATTCNVALRKLAKALREDRYALVAIRFLKPMSQASLQLRAGTRHEQKLARQAEAKEALVYGRFCAWPVQRKQMGDANIGVHGRLASSPP